LSACRRLAPVAALLALLACGQAPHDSATTLSPAARRLRDYVRLDTTHDAGTQLAVEYLEAILEATGAQVERLDAGDGLPSLWAYLPATGEPTGETLLLLHHLDVVAAEGEWLAPPFSAEVRGGELWGRGAIDSKGLGIAHLQAFVDLAASPTRRRRAVAFLAAADEERGGALGVERWLARRPDLFSGVAAVVNEGGLNRGHDGRLHWWGIEVAQKRPLWIEATASPTVLIAGLTRLIDRAPRWRVPPITTSTFARMAPLYNEHWREFFLDLERFVRPDGPTLRLLPGMETFFLDSIQVNDLEVLADGQARALIDIRLLPDTDQPPFLEEVTSLLGPDVETTVLLSSPPVAASPWSNPWIEVLAAELSATAPIVPQMVAGATDSRFFRQRGIPAYGFSPFILNSEFTRTVHSANERIPLDEFERGVSRMTRLVATWAAGPPPAR
jgi:acetylornithine deacetylase/succinyl-diaminopimelate desuccinylase-like protein